MKTNSFTRVSSSIAAAIDGVLKLSAVTTTKGAFIPFVMDFAWPGVSCATVFSRIVRDGAMSAKLRTPSACARYSSAPAKM